MRPSTNKKVDAEELQKLIDNEEVESQTLEYKGKVPGKADSEMDPAIKTVCAFANTMDGRIILGMETDQDGIPRQLNGIAKAAVDQSKQHLESKLRAGIEPRVPPPDIGVVEIAEDEHVLVVDVAESWVGPHRWTRNSHFYRRTSESNRELDIGEVRTAFARSEGFTDRVANFRTERVWTVQSERTPVPLKPGGRMILHIVPRAAFSSATAVDTRARPESTRPCVAAATPPPDIIGNFAHTLERRAPRREPYACSVQECRNPQRIRSKYGIAPAPARTSTDGQQS